MGELLQAVGITVYEYKFYCISEAKWVYVTKRSTEPPPEKCPNNSGHIVNLDTRTIISVIDNKFSSVRIKQWDFIPSEIAESAERGYPIQVVAGQSISTLAYSFPYKVDIVCGSLYNARAEADDIFSVCIRPVADSIVGITIANAESGQKQVTLDAGPYGYFKPGYFIEFANHSEEYEISSMNDSIDVITLRENLVSSVPQSTPVKFRRYFVYRRNVGSAAKGELPLGQLIVDASGLLTSLEMVAEYEHSTPPTEDYVIRPTITYVFGLNEQLE